MVREAGQVDSILWFVIGESAIADFSDGSTANRIGWFDPRTPEQLARSLELRDLLETRFGDIGRMDLIEQLDLSAGHAIGPADGLPPDVQTLASEYDALRQPGAVFEEPSGASPSP